MNTNKILRFIIKYSIYGLVFLIPLFWLPWTFEGYEMNKQYLLFFLALLAFLAWIARMIISKKRLTFLRSPLDLFVLIFALVIIFSAVFSIDKFSSWFGFYGRFSDSAIGILALILVYFVLTNNLFQPKKSSADLADSPGLIPGDLAGGRSAASAKKREKGAILSLAMLVKLFLVSGFVLEIIIYLSLFGFWGSFSGLPEPMKIIAFNPATPSLEGLSIFLVIIAILATFLFLNQKGFCLFKDKKGLIKEKSRDKKFLTIGNIFVYLLLITSVILLLIIRFHPAWLVFGITMFFLLGLILWSGLIKTKINLLVLPIALLGISIFAYAGLFDNTASWFSLGSLPNELMLDYQTAKGVTISSVKTYPVLGSGPGTFLDDFSLFKPVEFNETGFWNVRFDRAPSHIMELIATSGLLGIISYLLVLFVFILFILPFFLVRKKMLGLSGKSQPLALLSFFIVWLALLIGQFIYPQITVLGFSFWFFTALSLVGLNELKPGFLKQHHFSFKRLPEISLLMNVFLLVLFFAVIGLFYLAGRFYWADVKYLQAINLSAAGDSSIKEMVGDLEQAVNLDKYRISYHMALSRLYLRTAWLEADKPEQERDLQLLQLSATGSFQQARLATSLAPNSVLTWENLGIIYRDSAGLVGGTLPFALEAFSRASELEPTNPLFFRERCRINLISDEKDWEKTLGFCQKAIDLKPTYLDAHLQLAMAYEQKGDLDQALKSVEAALNKLRGVSFERGSALASAASEIYFQLGRIHFNLGHINDAGKMFSQAAIIMPEYANAHYGLALCYEKQGRLQEALAEFEIINQLVPGNETIEQAIQQLKEQLK